MTLLEASAGTGKTYSITNLVLRLVVEHALPIDRILVVTFTEAATAELRDRIRTRLRDALAHFLPGPPPVADDEILALAASVDRDAARKALERAIAGFDEAAISTIHGFCRKVLQDNAFESGADFDAELVADLDDLLREVVEDFWIRAVHEASPTFVRHLAARRIGVDSLLDLARKVAADPDPDVRPAPRDGDVDGATERYEAALDHARGLWRAERAAILATVAAAGDHLYARHPLFGPSKLDAAATRLDGWFASAASLSDDVAAFSQDRFVRETKVKAKALTPRHAFFEACDALCAAAAAVAGALDDRALALRHALVAYVREVLPRRKQAMHVRSFDDLLALVADALTRPDTGGRLADAVRARYDAALIDEFQDTDPVQWTIFHRLFGDGARWLYLIGDPKQAIYGFRGADIFTYLDAKTAAGTQQALGRNFRSDGRLVRAVNGLFEHGRGGEPFLYEGIPFHPVDAHHAGDRLRWPDGATRAPLRLRVLTRAEPDADKPINKGEVEETLPPLVAAEIAALLASGATLEDGRAVLPRDVAVLVRKNKQARAVQEALRARGIPAVIQGGESVFAAPEALELLRVLTALTGTSDARRVKAALATDLFGLDAAALAAMETDETRWEDWLDRLRAWRRLWAEHGFMRLFRALLADLGLPERLLAWRDGERRLTNLLHLAELLHAAAVEERLEPSGLVRWLAQQRIEPDAGNETRKLRLETDADAVEIVTIHASKGLEYPVVFCPYLWDGVGRREDAHLRCHDAGESILDVEIDQRSPDRRAHLNMARREEQAENMRLLYVALTRARQACVVHWGLVNECGTSPLAYLLHRPAGADPLEDTAARVKAWKGDDAEMMAELEALAARSDGCIAVERAVLGQVDAARYVPPPAPHVELRTSEFDRTRPLDTLWRRASFSQMKHAGREDMPALLAVTRDYDAAEAASAETPAAAEGDLIATAKVMGGNVFGTAVHKVFEDHDFRDADPESLRRRVLRTLVRYGVDPEGAEPVTAAIAACLDTPLDASGLRLRDIGRADRLCELAFDFPVGGRDETVTRDALVAAMRAHRAPNVPPDYVDRLARLRFPALRGYLTGHIDLVFRRDGRWYVVDYKTNYLGDRTGHYAPARLVAEMSAQHYFLQAAIYAVALHRYLRWRLPDYDPATHFGGVYYLFVRGMDPAAGPSRGVYVDRPTPALIEALSAVFDAKAN